MLSRPLPVLGVPHPVTGAPIRAIGWRPDGSPLWPIMGGADDPVPPSRPDDISEDDWTALGDVGQAAVVRERAVATDLRSQLAAAKARPKPPTGTPPAPPVPPAPNQPPAPPSPPAGTDPADIASIVQVAVAAAVKPLQDAEQARQHQAAADQIAAAVTDAAKTLFVDPTDALAGIDLTQVTDGNGAADQAKIKTELDALLTRKPHLGLGARTGVHGVGATPPPPANTDDQVKAILAQMQTHVGHRPRTT